MSFLLASVALVASAALSVNVRDFGAVGDGVHDDTLAIQRAADSVYPDNEWKDGRDKVMLRTRYRRASPNGVAKEIYFPEGTYRVNGSVMFSYPVCVRGEGKCIIRNESETDDTFYFHLAYYARLSGLTFEGGCNQIRVWNRNTQGPIYISRCHFRKARGTSVILDSLMFNDGVFYGAAAGKRPDCSPYEISRLPDGRVRLEKRDLAKLKKNYASALQVIDRCTFVDNVHAIHAYSDGLVIRDCDFKAPRWSQGPVVKNGAQSHLARLRIFVEKNPAAPQWAIESGNLLTSASDITVASDGEVDAFRCLQKSYGSSIVACLRLKDVKIDTSAGALVRFPDGCFPSLVSVHTLVPGKRVTDRRRLFVFDREPTAETGDGWYAEHTKGRNIVIPRMADEVSYGIALEGVDASRFDVTLPPALERFRRKVPGSIRHDAAHFDYSGDYGGEIVAADIGTSFYSQTNDTDTAVLEGCFAAAEGKGSATVVLPAKWIKTTRPIALRGKVKVVGRGLSCVTGLSDEGPIFEIADGTDVYFENVIFHRGRHAVETKGRSARVRMEYCLAFDQANETIRSVAETLPSHVRIEVTAGNSDTHSYYRGNAFALFDGTQYNPTSNWFFHEETREAATDPSQQYCPIVNLAGGRLEMHDILSTPWFFESYRMASTFTPNPPTPGQMGDRRYIDNWGDLHVSNFRFGGEWGGLSPVYQYGEKSKTYIEGGYVINNCPRLRAGMAAVLADTPKADVTIVELGTCNFLKQIPAYAVWRDSDGNLHNLDSLKESNSFPFSHPK